MEDALAVARQHRLNHLHPREYGIDILSLKNDVNVPSKSNKQKNFFLNLFFVGVLKVNDENSRIGSESGSISQRHVSADPDPDPYQNVMDPQHY